MAAFMPGASGNRLESRRAPAADAVTALTVFLGLQLAIPSALRIPALGGIGYLAALWALCLGLWWCWGRLRNGLAATSVYNPIKACSFGLLASVILSYACAMRRPLPPLEASQADLGVARILVALSIVLIASDGVIAWERFLTLLRRTALAGGLLAALGLVQFLTKRSLTESISIPGFIMSDTYSAVVERAGFVRPNGTAMHPLEYASALSVILPIALTLAIYDKDRPAIRRWGPAWIILAAMILSNSRSAYLGLIIGVVVLAAGWNNVTRLRIFGAILALLTTVFLTVPGMLGTIRGLFIYIDEDPSTKSRTTSYEMVLQFFHQSPFVGRGFGTFLPGYRILDNQILLILIEIGLIGMAILLALIISAALGPWMVRRNFLPGLQREAGRAITAGVLGGVSLLFFFDAFTFPISFGIWFLIVGLSGAYWNLARARPCTLDDDRVASRVSLGT